MNLIPFYLSDTNGMSYTKTSHYLSLLAFLTVMTLQVQAGGRTSYSPLPDPDGKPANMKKPVHVFILMGQSNMLGFGKVSGGDGSLEHAVKNKNLYPYLIDDGGNWTVRKDVRNVRTMVSKGSFLQLNDWLSASTGIGGKGRGNIGPELGIGHYVGNALDAPVLILKTCIGNRSLGWDLLPPGSQPYQSGGKTVPGYRGTPNNPKGNGQKVAGEWYAGKQYDDDTENAKKVLADLSTYYPGAKDYVIAGFCFWQGAKDGGSSDHAEQYEKNLVQFISALRKDFNAPKAPFVVATMGHGQKGSGGNAGKITDAQLAVDGSKGKYKQFKGNVGTFYSNPVSKGGSANGHYNGNAETYMNVGEGMGQAMTKLLGGFSSSGGGASADESLFPAQEFTLLKKEVSDIKRKKAYKYILSSLDKTAGKDGDKAEQAKKFAKELRAFIKETKEQTLSQAKEKPALTLINLKDQIKLMKGLDEEDSLEKCEDELTNIKNIRSLMSLYKKKDSIDKAIAKKGKSSYTESSSKRLIKGIEKFLEKKDLDQMLIKEAKALISELGG